MPTLPPGKVRSLVFALLALTAIACEESTGPRLGYVQLSVQTTGGDQDNRFEITSDTIRLSISPNAFSTLQLPAGPRSFELKDIADNCTVDGSSIASVEIPRNDTVHVAFKVGCAETGLSIETRTTGSELPATFQVLVPSLPTVFIGANGVQSYTRLPVGQYEVKLRVGAPHCSVTGDSAVTADVVNRHMTPVIFNVQCIAAPRTGVIAFGENSRILVMNADGSNVGDLNRGWWPSWSRDGKKLVYSTTECDYYTYVCSGSLAIVDPITRQITVLSGARVGIQPDWSPTDDVIAYTDANTLTLYLFNLATSIATPVPLPQGVLAFHPSWSPDGTRLVASCYIPGISATLCIMNRDGSGIHYIATDSNFSTADPTWSPDGTQIVFYRFANNESTISLINPDGSGLRNLTTGWQPSWSPDSQQIIFTTQTGLFLINNDGSSLRRLTSGSHYSPAWRPQ